MIGDDVDSTIENSDLSLMHMH